MKNMDKSVKNKKRDNRPKRRQIINNHSKKETIDCIEFINNINSDMIYDDDTAFEILYDCFDHHLNLYLMDKLPATYKEYKFNICKELQFSYYANDFKSLLYQILDALFSGENRFYPSLNVDISNFKLSYIYPYIIKAIGKSVYDNYNEITFRQTLKDYGYYDSHAQVEKIWEFFCKDMEVTMDDITKEIKSKKLEKIDIINKYNNINSAMNWSIYMSEMINIDGITEYICYIIVQFVDYEYPMYFCHNLDVYDKSKYKTLGIEHAEICSDKMKGCSGFMVLYRSKNDNVEIGQIVYGNDPDYDIAYYYTTRNKQESFVCNSWISLWNKIKDISVKINCYKPLKDIMGKVIKTNSIYPIITEIEKQKQNKLIQTKLIQQRRTAIKLKEKEIESKLKLKWRNKRNERVLEDFKQYIINKAIKLRKEKEKKEYDFIVRAQRKYLQIRIKNEIYKRNTNNVIQQKKIWKLENRFRKLTHMKQIEIRNRLKALIYHKNARFLVYGFVHCMEKERNHCIPMDIIQLIYGMYFIRQS